jgi:hypothetical protein
MLYCLLAAAKDPWVFWAITLLFLRESIHQHKPAKVEDFDEKIIIRAL